MKATLCSSSAKERILSQGVMSETDSIYTFHLHGNMPHTSLEGERGEREREREREIEGETEINMDREG